MQDQRLEWLKPKMDYLFEMKKRLETDGKNFNTSIQSLREYRNPRICEKLIEAYNIKQNGTNFSKEVFDPDAWRNKPEAFYESRTYRKLSEKRDIERKQDADRRRDRDKRSKV